MINKKHLLFMEIIFKQIIGIDFSIFYNLNMFFIYERQNLVVLYLFLSNLTQH